MGGRARGRASARHRRAARWPATCVESRAVRPPRSSPPRRARASPARASPERRAAAAPTAAPCVALAAGPATPTPSSPRGSRDSRSARALRRPRRDSARRSASPAARTTPTSPRREAPAADRLRAPTARGFAYEVHRRAARCASGTGAAGAGARRHDADRGVSPTTTATSRLVARRRHARRSTRTGPARRTRRSTRSSAAPARARRVQSPDARCRGSRRRRAAADPRRSAGGRAADSRPRSTARRGALYVAYAPTARGPAWLATAGAGPPAAGRDRVLRGAALNGAPAASPRRSRAPSSPASERPRPLPIFLAHHGRPPGRPRGRARAGRADRTSPRSPRPALDGRLYVGWTQPRGRPPRLAPSAPAALEPVVGWRL